MATFDGQSHLEIPSTGRFHINSDSLSTDIHQQTSDHRTRYVKSPMTATVALPFTTLIPDGQKVENGDLSKKIFMDRQIKKAKSMSGLIK